MEINKLFRACVKYEASELHLMVGRPPMVCVDGTLRPMSRGPLGQEEITSICLPMLDEDERNTLVQDGRLNCEHKCRVDGALYCFRINLQQSESVTMIAQRLDMRSS